MRSFKNCEICGRNTGTQKNICQSCRRKGFTRMDIVRKQMRKILPEKETGKMILDQMVRAEWKLQ